ncbi:MAG: hypothetical protein M1827_003005 [Pycnora praestabilis]|nr:MAG: hypothetical protein M1827_003005 [Pycnora praestabilis]
MPSELDPLLPKNKPAPEITQDGDLPDEQYEYHGQDHEPQSSRRLNLNRISIIFVAFSSLFFLAAILVPGGLTSRWQDPEPPKDATTVEERANQILSETPLIDGHNDLAITIRFTYDNHIYDSNFTEPFEKGGFVSHVDLPRLTQGKVGGSFWSAFWLCPKNGTDFSDEAYAPVIHGTLLQIDLLKRLQAAYPTTFSPPPNSSSALSFFKTGHLISPLAIEGLHQIGNSISNLRLYHSLGVRYSTLTWNCHNPYADAAVISNTDTGESVASKPYWGGVSKRGQDVIKEMNRLGMIVDLAHVSKDTMLDVLGGRPERWNGSAAPIIFSHSSAYAICPHPRNVPDDVLQLVKKTDSLVMVNFSPDFVSCVESDSPSGMPDFYPPNSTLAHVVRHITHIGHLIGYDHVGLGSDFDGIESTPAGLEDVSKFPDLVAEMLRQGVSDEDAGKVVGGNLLRVWAAVDKVALQLQAEIQPVED